MEECPELLQLFELAFFLRQPIAVVAAMTCDEFHGWWGFREWMRRNRPASLDPLLLALGGC